MQGMVSCMGRFHRGARSAHGYARKTPVYVSPDGRESVTCANTASRLNEAVLPRRELDEASELLRDECLHHVYLRHVIDHQSM